MSFKIFLLSRALAALLFAGAGTSCTRVPSRNISVKLIIEPVVQKEMPFKDTS